MPFRSLTDESGIYGIAKAEIYSRFPARSLLRFILHVRSGARTGHSLLNHCLQKNMYTFIMPGEREKSETGRKTT